MSLILSIETSTLVCSVALHKDGELMASQELFLENSHAACLIPIIDNLIHVSGYEKNDLLAIAISKGPGSYTGLRIGTSTAKGLCLSLDLPLISVNTLQAMALNVNKYNTEGYMLCPMLDARRMEVYLMMLNENLDIVKETEAHILTEDSFLEILQNKKVLFFGNGSSKAKPLFSENQNAIFIDDIKPSAEQVGYLATVKFKNNDFEDLAYFEPFYLKDFVSNASKKIVS